MAEVCRQDERREREERLRRLAEEELRRLKRPFKPVYIPAAIMAALAIIEILLHLNR